MQVVAVERAQLAAALEQPQRLLRAAGQRWCLPHRPALASHVCSNWCRGGECMLRCMIRLTFTSCSSLHETSAAAPGSPIILVDCQPPVAGEDSPGSAIVATLSLVLLLLRPHPHPHLLEVPGGAGAFVAVVHAHLGSTQQEEGRGVRASGSKLVQVDAGLPTATRRRLSCARTQPGRPRGVP